MPAKRNLFRNCTADPPKNAARDTISDFPCKIKEADDSGFMAASATYLALAADRGGCQLMLFKADATGTANGTSFYNLSTATDGEITGTPTSLEFCPYNDNLLLVGTNAGEIVLVEMKEEYFTDGFLKSEVTDKPLVYFSACGKEINYVHWHPTAQNVVAFSAKNYHIYFYDLGTQEYLFNSDNADDERWQRQGGINALAWNWDGSLFGFTEKQKKHGAMFICDPRNAERFFKIETQLKALPMFFIKTEEEGCQIAGVLGNAGGKEQIHMYKVNIESGENTLIHKETNGIRKPIVHVDNGRRILFVYGKGGLGINCFDINADGELKNIMSFKGYEVISGGCWLHQRGCRPLEYEIQRVYLYDKKTKKFVHPVPVIVPRKNKGGFEQKLYPDIQHTVPSMDSAEYLSGANKDPMMRTCDPSKEIAEDGGVVFRKKKSYAELEGCMKEAVKLLQANDVDLPESLQEYA